MREKQNKSSEEMKELQKEVETANKIIYNLAFNRDMDMVFDFNTFKVREENKMLTYANKGVIFMGDIDNLGRVVYENGDDVANRYVYDLIRQIRTTMRNEKVYNYEIGKLGDEIYIYAPEIDEDTATKILESFNSIKNEKLTITFGATANLQNGLEKAISIADEKMRNLKQKRKFGKIKDKTIGEMLESLSQSIDEKLHIYPDNLEKDDLIEYNKNKAACIERLMKEVKNDDSKENNSVSLKERAIEVGLRKCIDKIKMEYIAKYPDIQIDPKTMEYLCIAKILQKTPIKSVKKIEYFYSEGYKKLIKSKSKATDEQSMDSDELQIESEQTRKDTMKSLKNTKLMTIHLGNIKYINDNYGHSECDQIVYEFMEKIIEKIEQSGIQLKTDIISKGISNYYILFDNDSLKQLEQVRKELADLETKSPISINCSTERLLIGENDDKTLYDQKSLKDVIIGSFADRANENGKEVEKISTKKKIRNMDVIYSAAKKGKTLLKKYVNEIKEKQQHHQATKKSSEYYR